MRPTFVAPELDPELQIAHCITPEALDAALAATPDAVGATVVSPTYFGAVADVRGLAEVAHAPRRPADRRRGLGRAPRLPRAAARRTRSRCGADLVVSSTHKIVGSLTQSAMLHLGTSARAGSTSTSSTAA